ncbi:MAG: OmpA family protein [Bacteroidota bacterium]
MKPRLLLFIFVICSYHLLAQESYYVVVGGFSIEKNAQRYVETLNQNQFNAHYALNPARNLFYVYVLSSNSRPEAFAEAKRLQGASPAVDAWVFAGKLSEGEGGVTATGTKTVEQAKPVEKVTKVEQEPVVEDKPIVEEKTVVDQPVVEQPADDNTVAAVDSTAKTEADTKPVTEIKSTPEGRPLLFKLMSSVTGNVVEGTVHLQEAEKANQFRGYEGNEIVYVVPPNNRAGRWVIVCQVVGYKEYKKAFDYKNPEKFEGATIGSSQEVIIPVQLTRVRKGDYIEMDKITFFKNSSIFTPESEPELKELVAMMNENPDYHIRIHGHTNGSESREITSLGESTNFFALDPGNKKEEGSAKKLSELRAAIVRDYLVANGIESSRIRVRGEGGSQMIVGKGSTLSSINDRVEMEITKH